MVRLDRKLYEHILKRDNCKCQVCSTDNDLRTSNSLLVHHIGFDDVDEPKNLITLCTMCHPLCTYGSHKSIGNLTKAKRLLKVLKDKDWNIEVIKKLEDEILIWSYVIRNGDHPKYQLQYLYGDKEWDRDEWLKGERLRIVGVKHGTTT